LKGDSETSAPNETAPIIRRRIKRDGQVVTDTLNASREGTIKETVSPAEAHHKDEQRQLSDHMGALGQTESVSDNEKISKIQKTKESAFQETPKDLQTSLEHPTSETKPEEEPIVIRRPTAPPRKFLTIVESPKLPPKPAVKSPTTPAKANLASGSKYQGQSTQDKDGFRIIKMTKENLDQMVEEEAAKKRSSGLREHDIRPEDLNFSDYRKKEMVFLPKKKRPPLGREIKKTEITKPKAEKRVVEMGESITVSELADRLKVKASDVIRRLMALGQMATVNQSLDFDTAALIASEYEYEVKNVSFNEEAVIDRGSDEGVQLVPRPPVVTVMGHVDHGKTSLLDAIRESDVASREAGGITQHIGAYTIEKNGKQITFIDTPGHEAFTSMRARGANVTDIVILVVSADDGVMPQTREALSHAKAAGVPIVVAINKIDKPGTNPEKVKQALAELDLLPEEWGGQTMYVPVSALKKINIDQLLDAVLLQAELLDLKANPEARASGTVLEARLDRGRGPVASLLVKRGTLKVGDFIISGKSKGKVKAMVDHLGHSIQKVTPGMAAEVLGFESVPNAGDVFDVVKNESDMNLIISNRLKALQEKASLNTAKVSLDDLFNQIQKGAVKELNVVLKADAFGSVEAIRDSLQKLSTDKVKVKVIHSGTGGVTESDVLLASASKAIILAFNVRPETKARQLAEQEKIEVKTYSIIYELIDDVKNSMAGLLDKKKVEKYLGRAEIRQTFNIPKVGTIAGCSVVDGKITRSANIRLLRDSRVIFEGKLASLKRFKDDAKEVAQGFECGMSIENYNDLKVGDLIEAFETEFVSPELNS
jgi:translation initiation factor IF-2